NPWKASTLASYALFLSGLEQWERAADLIETAIRLSPHHPAWFHMVPYLKRYHEEDFDGALEEAARVVTPDLIWGPVARAAALGRLGRLEEARYEYEDVLARQPEFEVRARKLLGRLLCSDGILEAVLGGLNAAGLPASTEDEAEGSVRLAR
ncbi:MAG: hypothetical protein OEU54_17010, partial [Gemmatimonadota bacterium]|nr:hypothetical protein [Gemmatimonadota bacterium]